MASNLPLPGGGSALPPGVYPQSFPPPSFAVPPLFTSSRDNSGMSPEPNAFTSDDRMVLKMLYHQQQAMQVQLNSIMTWMQHVSGVISALERRSRDTPLPASQVRRDPMEGVAPQPSPQVPQHVGGPSVVTAGGSVGGGGGGLPRTAVGSSSSSAVRHEKVADSSRLSGSHAVLESRSCTPPRGGEDAGSAHQSLNRSIESIAAPWDPSSKRPANMSSARSSRGSQLGRNDNPLLSSMQSALGRSRPASVASRTNSIVGSTATAAGPQQQQIGGGIGGYSASANQSMESEDVLGGRAKPIIGPRSVPQQRGPAPPERDIPPYRGVSLPSSMQAGPKLGVTASTHSSSLRGDAPPPPPAAASASASSQPLATTASASTTRRAPSANTVEEERQPSTGGSAGSQRTNVYRERMAAADALAGYESLSDGYGSYESRQYMKGIGLL